MWNSGIFFFLFLVFATVNSKIQFHMKTPKMNGSKLLLNTEEYSKQNTPHYKTLEAIKIPEASAVVIKEPVLVPATQSK